MSQWIKFSIDKPNKENSGNINSSIPGGRYIGLGKHLVKIDGVEQAVTRNGDPYYKITYVNEAGQVLLDRLYPLYGQNGDLAQSFKYKSLAHGLIPEDGVLRFEFFTSNSGVLPENPELWTGLVGLFVEIEVTRGRNGYTIEDDGGVYRLWDVKTKDFITLSGGIPNEFESYKEAHAVAREQGIYRAGYEVNKFHASADHAESNAEVIKSLKDGLPKGSI
jgi:hypothetical protein